MSGLRGAALSPAEPLRWLPDADAAWNQLLATGRYSHRWHSAFPVSLERFRRQLRARARDAGHRLQTRVCESADGPLLDATLPHVLRATRQTTTPQERDEPTR